jgi:hypothetical protein
VVGEDAREGLAAGCRRARCFLRTTPSSASLDRFRVREWLAVWMPDKSAGEGEPGCVRWEGARARWGGVCLGLVLALGAFGLRGEPAMSGNLPGDDGE